MTARCAGPLVWFDAPPSPAETAAGATAAAILECATCGYLIVTGNVNDEAHSNVELLREGMAA